MKALGIFSLCAAAATLAIAADPPPRTKIEVRKPPAVAPPAERVTGEPGVDHAGTIRSSELMGMELILQDGNAAGKIADLVIDAADAQISHVVVETDGDYRAIPFKTVSLNFGSEPADRYVVLGMEPRRFVEAPAIPQVEWRTYTPTQWRTYVPSVTTFFADVHTVRPGEIRRADRAIDRNVRQGERKADRKLD